MDISVLQGLSIDVLVAILVIFASLSFTLLSILIKFVNKIGKLEEKIDLLLNPSKEENKQKSTIDKEDKNKKDSIDILESINKIVE